VALAMATSPDAGARERVSAAAIARLLAEVEDVPRTDVGALVLERGAEREGVVLVEAGRVCWAAASRMPRRLTDLLLERSAGLDPSTLQGVFRRCRAEGRPLGESLVEDGLLSADGFRAALLDHTVDGLARLAAERAARPRWISRNESSYDPRFTFSTVELATVAASRQLPDVASRSAEALARLLPGGTSGAALYRGGSGARPVPVAHRDADEIGVGGLDGLSSWAVSSLDIASVFADSACEVVAHLSSGERWVGWRDGDLVYVAVCPRAPQLAALLGRLRRR